MPDRYARIAPFYDALCALGSFGAVGRCKRDALRVIRPGDRVLFAGAGTGKEAALAAQSGAIVTVCDISPAMLARLPVRSGMTVVNDDIRHVAKTYDVVVANFFLNVFPPETMRDILAHLAGCVAPEGRIVVGDVILPDGRAARMLTRLYWTGASLLFRLLTRNAVHPVYDYAGELKALGFRTENRRVRCGCFGSLEAKR